MQILAVLCIALLQCQTLFPALVSAQTYCTLGKTPGEAAKSCRDIYDCNPKASSGSYWLASYVNSRYTIHQMYCDMTTERCGVKGGWTRVANLNARYNSCPTGLIRTSDPSYMCIRESSSAGCSSASFKTYGMSYSRVCGRATGYKKNSVDGLHREQKDINKPYLDGLSLTHGYPRKHIWSFAADHAATIRNSASFVGSDFFIETTLGWHTNSPKLWDGLGCKYSSNCAKSGQPWFCRQFPLTTRDNIELRVCRNQDRSDEDVGVQELEVYIN